MNTEVVYFCFCGKVHIFGDWTFQTKELWAYLNQQVQNDAIEIRICSNLCPDCYQAWLDGKKHDHMRLGGL